MIYFVQGTQTKNIKIGKANKTPFLSRFNGIQSSDPLVCLGVVEGEDDFLFQQRFKHLWSHGEWFLPAKELLEFIEGLPLTEYTNLKQTGLGPWNRRSYNKGRKQTDEQRFKISSSQKIRLHKQL